MNQRRVNSDADRMRVRDFFASTLPDPTAWPIKTRAADGQIGVPSTFRIVEDGKQEIIAAIYASNNPEDVIKWRRSEQHQVADVISNEMVMIHAVAVAPKSRRSGIGRQLVDAILDDARLGRASVAALLFDSTHLELERFYRSAGFDVLGGGESLQVKFADLPMVLAFPQADPRYRWAYRVLNRARAGILERG